MAISKPMKERDKQKVQSVLSQRGRIMDCFRKTGVERNTIARIKDLGRGEESNINKILEYVKSVA